jgi:hypothetical protein
MSVLNPDTITIGVLLSLLAGALYWASCKPNYNQPPTKAVPPRPANIRFDTWTDTDVSNRVAELIAWVNAQHIHRRLYVTEVAHHLVPHIRDRGTFLEFLPVHRIEKSLGIMHWPHSDIKIVIDACRDAKALRLVATQ